MGAGYIYECGKCAYTFHTSGPWEFYRNHEGELKDYGHPSPNSKEAKLTIVLSILMLIKKGVKHEQK